MRNMIIASAAAATVVAGLGIGAPAYAQSGSYQGSCRNVRSANGVLTAECADGGGRFHQSSIPFGQCKGDIGNNNGMLSCTGAVASGGAIVAGGNDRNRNNNGNVAGAAAAGVVAGALLGGALAGNQPPPPPVAYGPPPAYGDPRYGDPRYDPHYAQGGWGYGHRPGEWVSIRDRADWLSMRIDRALRDGRIGREDARDLRRQLNGIEDLEGQYLRDRHLGPGERADLDRRFDDLSRRISYDAGPAGPPPRY